MGSIRLQVVLVVCLVTMSQCDGGRTSSDGQGTPAEPDESALSKARQPDRQASIFANLSFEELDANGAPTAWQCGCASGVVACQTTQQSPKHGKRALVLPKGCYAIQSTTRFDATKRLRFDLFESGGAVFRTDIEAASTAEVALVAPLTGVSKTWRAVTNLEPLRTADAQTLQLWVYNSSAIDMRVDDLIAVQDQPNPAPKSGSLVIADHFERFSYEAGTTPGVLYTPLPLDSATQVPLSVELDVKPASIVDRIEYTHEAEGNWGALIHFQANATADAFTLEWHSIVMTRTVTDEERPQVFAAQADPATWLPASALIDSSYAPLAMTARSLAAQTATPLEKMLATIRFTQPYMTSTAVPKALDSTTVFNDKAASCTGYANLAAATGRALGVPTRHVVNIMVGLSQEMHSIDEFYLGADLGWRRVEPQDTAAKVAEDYGFIMRLVLPGDETAEAVNARPWAAGGVPLRELTQAEAAPERFTVGVSRYFSDCDECMNRADIAAVLRAPPEAVKATFEQARQSWRRERAAGAGYTPNAGSTNARRAFRTARSLDEVNAILSTLPH